MNFAKKINILKYVVLVGGVIILIMGLVDYNKIASLESEGKTIQGEISSRPILNTGKGRSSYNLVIDYQPTKKTIYRKEFTVTEEFYNTVKNLHKIDIKYLKNEPEISSISGNITEQKHPVYVGSGVFIFSVIIFLFISSKSVRDRFTSNITKK